MGKRQLQHEYNVVFLVYQSISYIVSHIANYYSAVVLVPSPARQKTMAALGISNGKTAKYSLSMYIGLTGRLSIRDAVCLNEKRRLKV